MFTPASPLPKGIIKLSSHLGIKRHLGRRGRSIDYQTIMNLVRAVVFNNGTDSIFHESEGLVCPAGCCRDCKGHVDLRYPFKQNAN